MNNDDGKGDTKEIPRRYQGDTKEIPVYFLHGSI